MDNTDLERYAALSPVMVTRLRVLEEELQAIDNAPVGYIANTFIPRFM